MSDAAKIRLVNEPLMEAVLPSGRTVLITDDERIEVHGSKGVEVTILLSDAGPVVKLQGAQVQLEATEALSLRCKSLTVDTDDDLSLRSGGAITLETQDELRLQSEADMRAVAPMIWLN